MDRFLSNELKINAFDLGEGASTEFSIDNFRIWLCEFTLEQIVQEMSRTGKRLSMNTVLSLKYIY